MPVKILVISDSHIHERADEIPKPFMVFFRSRSYDIVVHAGDLVDKDVLVILNDIAPERYVVSGNMDYLDLPETRRFIIYGIPVGVIHGHQVRPRGNVGALTQIARDMKVNILISGHTHSPYIAAFEDILHLNPGSVTGAWGGGGGSMIPSFIDLEINELGEAHVRLYELRGNEVALIKYEVYEQKGEGGRWKRRQGSQGA